MANIAKVDITSKATAVSPNFSMHITEIDIEKGAPRYVTSSTGVKRVSAGRSRLGLGGVLKSGASSAELLNRPSSSDKYTIEITPEGGAAASVCDCECVNAALTRIGTSGRSGVAVYAARLSFEFQPYDWEDSAWMWDSLGAEATTRTISSAASHSEKGSVLIDMDYTVWEWQAVIYKYDLRGTSDVLQGPGRETEFLVSADYIEIGEGGTPQKKYFGQSASRWTLRRDTLDQSPSDAAARRTQIYTFKTEPLPHENAMVVAESDMGGG